MKTRGASVALLNHKGQVLLCLRDHNSGIPYPGKWDVPGGHLEDGEEPLTCIRREISEEIKHADGSPVVLIGPALFKRYDLPDRIEWMYWERADLDLDEIILTEGERLEWFSKERIEQMPDDAFAFGFRELLLEFFKNPFSA
jgi:8-oxo-dGTP diphosphatase